jgi:RNA polymerase sigma factor (sigma-70 family)
MDMQEQIQDQEIIRQVLQGKKQAYAILVERYQNYVFTLVMRYIKNREEAEEVAQDVFVKAYRYLADFRGQSKFSTWLYTIVNTTCISFLRKNKEQVVLIEEEQMHNLTNRLNMSDKPSDYSERRSEKQMMEQAIKQLPELDGQIITLFYQHEQSLEEIGAVVGLTANNIKIRLFRARQKLKEILQQEYKQEVFNTRHH